MKQPKPPKVKLKYNVRKNSKKLRYIVPTELPSISKTDKLKNYLAKHKPEPKRRMIPHTKIRPIRHTFTKEQIKRITILRYGLNPNQSEPERSCRQVADILGIGAPTVHEICRRFEANGY